MSIEIGVIQFLRPFGEKRLLSVEVSDEAGRKFKDEIAPLGLRLTAEVIPMGSEEEEVSIAIEDPDWGDFSMAIAPNRVDGVDVVRETEAMILAFQVENYHDWLASVQFDDED